MTTNSQTARYSNRHADKASHAILGTLMGLGVKALANVKSALRAIQTARMTSVLASMSDAQLAQIGITRSEIPQHAERLIADE